MSVRNITSDHEVFGAAMLFNKNQLWFIRWPEKRVKKQETKSNLYYIFIYLLIRAMLEKKLCKHHCKVNDDREIKTYGEQLSFGRIFDTFIL